MPEQVVFKNSFLIGLVSLLQVAVPAVAAVVSLFVVNRSYGVPIDDDFFKLSALVVVLALALLQRPRELETRLVGERGALTISIILRWFLLLAILLAIGYATKFSATYSRRVV